MAAGREPDVDRSRKPSVPMPVKDSFLSISLYRWSPRVAPARSAGADILLRGIRTDLVEVEGEFLPTLIAEVKDAVKPFSSSRI